MKEIAKAALAALVIFLALVAFAVFCVMVYTWHALAWIVNVSACHDEDVRVFPDKVEPWN